MPVHPEVLFAFTVIQAVTPTGPIVVGTARQRVAAIAFQDCGHVCGNWLASGGCCRCAPRQVRSNACPVCTRRAAA